MCKASNLNLMTGVIFILVSVLSGCSGPTSRHSPDQQLLSLAEDKPYPAMDSFQFEGMPFGFALKLSHPPSEVTEIPGLIVVEQTMFGNRVEGVEGNEKIRTILQSFRAGEISVIAVNGVRNKSFSLKGTAEPGAVTYRMETNLDLELISFEKEISYAAGPLQENKLKLERLVAGLIATYGRPQYVSTKANTSGLHRDLWWGADEKILITSSGYAFYNASHWKGFKGKTFSVSIHSYNSGEILIRQTMTDNFRAFRNGYLDQTSNLEPRT